MTMSPLSSTAASSPTVSPAIAAGTMIQAARGAVSLFANSASERAPVAPSLSSCAIAASLTS